jgi:hypothetical protein
VEQNNWQQLRVFLHQGKRRTQRLVRFRVLMLPVVSYSLHPVRQAEHSFFLLCPVGFRDVVRLGFRLHQLGKLRRVGQRLLWIVLLQVVAGRERQHIFVIRVALQFLFRGRACLFLLPRLLQRVQVATVGSI